MLPLELLGICPLNRGCQGLSSYHVHDIARPGLSAATVRTRGRCERVRFLQSLCTAQIRETSGLIYVVEPPHAECIITPALSQLRSVLNDGLARSRYRDVTVVEVPDRPP